MLEAPGHQWGDPSPAAWQTWGVGPKRATPPGCEQLVLPCIAIRIQPLIDEVTSLQRA